MTIPLEMQTSRKALDRRNGESGGETAQPPLSGLRDKTGFYIPALDGLRALSITGVIMAHVKVFDLFSLERRGWYGVDVFFVLSGFLITWILATELEKRKSINIRRFYIRRFLRLQPAYVSSLFWSIGFAAIFIPSSIHRMMKALPFLLTYTFNMVHALGFVVAAPLPPAWSLCIEEQFYLFWSVILRRLGVRQGLYFALAAVAVVGLLRTFLFVWLTGGLSRPLSVYNRGLLGYSTFTRVDTIFAGCALALALKDGRTAPILRRIGSLRWYPLLASACSIALIMWGTSADAGGFMRASSFGGTIMAISVAGVILAIFLRPNSLLSKVLSIKPLVFIGEISYGMYLFHPLVLGAIRMIFASMFSLTLRELQYLAFPVVYLLTILIAWLHYQSIEKYFLSLRRIVEERSSSRYAAELVVRAATPPQN